MWFLAPKIFSAKSVKKWPKFGQKMFSRPKKGRKCGFWPQKNFQPNQLKNGRNLTKRHYLGPKRVKNVVLAPKIFLAKSVEKWPKFGQKTLSRSKKGQKCGFGPEIFFQPNRSKNGQKTLSRPKNGQKCGFLPPKKIQPNWSKNGQNMAKRCFLGLKGLKKWFWA